MVFPHISSIRETVYDDLAKQMNLFNAEEADITVVGEQSLRPSTPTPPFKTSSPSSQRSEHVYHLYPVFLFLPERRAEAAERTLPKHDSSSFDADMCSTASLLGDHPVRAQNC